MAKLLLGKEVTDALNANLQTRTAALREKGIVPTLGIIRVGADPSDLSYEKGATKRAELVGVEVKKFELPADATKEDVLAVIDQVNAEAARELVEGNEQGCTNLVLHSAVNSVLYKLLTVKLTNLPRPDLGAEADHKPQEG